MKRNLLLILLSVALAACSSPTSSLDADDQASSISGMMTAVASKKGDSAFGDPMGQPAEVCNDANFRPFSYTLWAGQSNDAGTVTVSTDGEMLFVAYDTNETADLEEVHIYVFTDAADVPERRPAPGQAPYKAENLNADTYTVGIPLSDLLEAGEILCDQTFYVLAHAALTMDESGSDDNAGETAYSGGNNNPGNGAWFYVSEYANFCDCQTRNCVAEGDLLAGQYNDIGTLTVSKDGDDLVVTYTLDEGAGELGELAIYVFTDPSDLTGDRPNPGHAPYKVGTDLLNGASSYSVRIPLADFGEACPLYIVAKTTVNGETTYGGLLGETGINVGAPGPWWYYLTLDCCA